MVSRSRLLTPQIATHAWEKTTRLSTTTSKLSSSIETQNHDNWKTHFVASVISIAIPVNNRTQLTPSRNPCKSPAELVTLRVKQQHFRAWPDWSVIAETLSKPSG